MIIIMQAFAGSAAVPMRPGSTTPTPWYWCAGPMQRETSIQLTGLCHSVQGTSEMLVGWIGAPYEELTYTCAGINHMAFI